MEPAYRVVTDRLVLRPWNPEDAPLLRDAVVRGKQHLERFMPWAHTIPTLDEELLQCRKMRGWFDLGEQFVYGAFLREDEGVIVGGTGLHPRVGPGGIEIGYWVDVDQVRRGFALEMASAMTRLGFELHAVARMEIHCDRENVASAAIPKKLGFAHEGTLKQRLPNADGSFGDRMIHTLFREQYPESPAARTKLEAYDGLGRALALSAT